MDNAAFDFVRSGRRVIPQRPATRVHWNSPGAGQFAHPGPLADRMARIVFVGPALFSHLRVYQALAAELAARGHDACYVGEESASAVLPDGPLRRVPLGDGVAEPGLAAAVAARRSTPFDVLRTVATMAKTTERLSRALPDMLRRIGADVVVADEMEAAGSLAAAHLRLPYVSLACAVTMRREALVPSPYLPFAYDPSSRGAQRNRGGELVGDLLMRRLNRTIEREAARLGLAPRRSLEDCLSPALSLTQMLPALDFPRERRPPDMHDLGPIRMAAPEAQAFDLQIDPARPFVFASFGTLQGARFKLFRKIVSAVRAIGGQILVAHCGCLDANRASAIGADWVTDFAPQRAVLARADLLVTHGGANTVLDGLEAGVPMLAFPMAFDQPGMVARLERVGAGIGMAPAVATTHRIANALARLRSGTYAQNAAELGRGIAAAGGRVRAADLIEAMLPRAVPMPKTA